MVDDDGNRRRSWWRRASDRLRDLDRAVFAQPRDWHPDDGPLVLWREQLEQVERVLPWVLGAAVVAAVVTAIAADEVVLGAIVLVTILVVTALALVLRPYGGSRPLGVGRRTPRTTIAQVVSPPRQVMLLLLLGTCTIGFSVVGVLVGSAAAGGVVGLGLLLRAPVELRRVRRWEDRHGEVLLRRPPSLRRYLRRRYSGPWRTTPEHVREQLHPAPAKQDGQ